MSDHDKLREAIEQVRVLAGGPLHSQAFPGIKHLTLLADAAELTLPKTKTVEVRAWALLVNGVVEGFTHDENVVALWHRGLVGADRVVALTGTCEVPT